MERTRVGTALLLLLAGGCATGQDGQAGPTPTVTRTVTVTETVTETFPASPPASPPDSPPVPPPASPSPDGQERERLTGDQFETTWTVDVTRRDGEWCMTARAAGESQEICGEAVALDEVHGGREVVSAVEFAVADLDITAGLVAEPVARVRIETAAPPENPGGGGTMEELEPVDAVVGRNAYAEADLDPTPDEPDLPTVRVVALDATGDVMGEAEPTAAGGER